MTDAREQSGIEVKLEFILKELDEIKSKLENNYVSQEAFLPVRNLVYGMVSLILVSVVGALITLIVK
jgi:hypothetical protein